MVEGDEVVHQLRHDRHLLLRVVVENLLGRSSIGGRRIVAQLFMQEPLLRWGQFALCDGLVVRQECAIKLNIIARNGMVRVIEHGVIAPRCAALLAFRRIRQVDGVAEGTVVNGIIQTLYRLTSQDVVDGAILHLQNDHILDLGFEVLDGRRRMGCPGYAGKRRGCRRKGKDAHQRTWMHSGTEPGKSNRYIEEPGKMRERLRAL